MAAPVANFQVTPTLLSVRFTDISTGTPTSWSWDFGDASAAVTTQNPTHAYASAGTYIVKLTATNGDGSSIIQREIRVSTVPILPVSLKTFVALKLPSSITVSEELKDAYIAQWQLYIQPLVSPVVAEADVFNESAYSPLANALIAMLAAYSSTINIISSGMVSSSGGGSSTVKKIVTGPSEVEFQASDISKTLPALVEQLKSEICTLGFRLMIQLPMCPKLPTQRFIDLKAGRNTLTTAEAQAFWANFPYSTLTC